MYRLTEQNKMSTTRNYTQVGVDNNPVWNPKVDSLEAFNPEDKANNIIEGYLIDIKHNIGKNNATIYSVHEVNSDGSFGDIYSVWGTVVLSNSIDKLELGTFICIEYKGLKMKKGCENVKFKIGTSHVHDFAVFTDDNALPYKQALNASKGQTNETAEPARQSSAPKAAAPAKSSRQAAPLKNNDSFLGDDLPF